MSRSISAACSRQTSSRCSPMKIFLSPGNLPIMDLGEGVILANVVWVAGFGDVPEYVSASG